VELVHEIRRHNRTADIIETTHRALYLQNLSDENDRRPLSFLRGKYIGAISGIACPESFEEKLTHSARSWSSPSASRPPPVQR
jgi:tetraacyldisaccharide 4'-kinase